MYPKDYGFNTMDYWSKEKSAFPVTDSQEETGFGHPAPRSGSCSPAESSSTVDTKSQFQFDHVFTTQQPLSMRRASAPYPRQQPVSYLPETVNAAWPTLSQQPSAFNNSCFTKRYVFEAQRCCATPRLRVFHECCNRESTPREMLTEPAYIPRRNMPISTKLTLCRFCLKNGEPPSVYYSHNLHMEDGRVSCPVLRRYDCPICNNGGGDFAHTVRYCPLLRAAAGPR